jgi:methionyl-tRNA synthetase
MKLVTCGLPYANGKAHIGHLRTYIPADVYVRYLRMMGEDVVFVCGSDSHGTPIVVNAEEAGLEPKQLVDIYHEHFQEVFKALSIKFDYYGRTDSDYHHIRTREIVQRLIEKGYVYPKEIELAYCPQCQRFLPDRYVEGLCPYCGAVARGDECDQGCGRHLEPGEILEPKCKICGSKAVYRKQKHYFFKLTEFQEFLRNFLSKLRGTENALNYAREWAKNLRDWCITRNLEWGVRFPGEEDLVVYVWVDAPIGYISFTEKACEVKGCDWREIWQKGEAEIIHFIGLDIVYHHCIFWPAMLKGADYSLPDAVVASGMVKVEGKTFSKSRGYVVWVEDDYLKSGLNVDYLRYYLVNYTSHQKDLNFSWEIFRDKVNNELIATLGNFMYRVLLFAWKNFGEMDVSQDEIDSKILERIKETERRIVDAINEWEFKMASDAFMDLATFGNAYFQSAKPWDLIKEDRTRAKRVVASCLQLVKALIIFAYPVMPDSMKKMGDIIGIDVERCKLEDALIVDGFRLKKPVVPFQKIEDEKIFELQKIMEARFTGGEKLEGGEERMSEEKPDEVTIDEFKRLDIRIGKIVEAERIEGSKKLLKLVVDVGGEKRQIVAGIAETYDPDNLVGRNVVVLLNLKPAKLMGVESRGMVLAAVEDGKAVLLEPEKDVKPGARVM